MRVWMTSALAVMAAHIATPAARAADDPVLAVTSHAFRGGPFAVDGEPLLDGLRDYFALVNARDGGLNGIPIAFDECETGFFADKGIECHEATRARSLVSLPWSAEVEAALLPRAAADGRAVLAPGSGLSAVADGTVFGWAFNPPLSIADGAWIMLSTAAGGKLDALRGKTVALLRADSAFGREPLALLTALAARHGFTLLDEPVSAREQQDQAAQWQRIAAAAPAAILVWGQGPMNAGAFAGAERAGVPMARVVAGWWSGSEATLVAAGPAARGLRLVSWTAPVDDAPVLDDLRRALPNRASASRESTLAYLRGLATGMIVTEAMRAAQLHFATRTIDAAQLRWGLEHLTIDAGRLDRLGMTGLVTPFATSCADHSGHGGAFVLEWTGERFTRVGGPVVADRAAVAPVEAEAARAFAAAHQPWTGNSCL